SPYYLSMRRSALKHGPDQRLALSSAAFDDETRRLGLPVPRRWGNFFLDHFFFLAAREDAILRLTRKPVEAARHPADRIDPWDQQQWKMKWKSIAGWVDIYEKNRKVNFPVYERMISGLREGGNVRIALLEGVQNPKLDASADDPAEVMRVRNQYRQDVQRFA